MLVGILLLFKIQLKNSYWYFFFFRILSIFNIHRKIAIINASYNSIYVKKIAKSNLNTKSNGPKIEKPRNLVSLLNNHIWWAPPFASAEPFFFKPYGPKPNEQPCLDQPLESLWFSRRLQLQIHWAQKLEKHQWQRTQWLAPNICKEKGQGRNFRAYPRCLVFETPARPRHVEENWKLRQNQEGKCLRPKPMLMGH